MSPEILIQSRKARRKEKRANKGKRRGQTTESETKEHASDVKPLKEQKLIHKAKKKGKRQRGEGTDSSEHSFTKKARKNDPYAHLDSDVAAALRRDDEEIAELEAKLGLGNKKEKTRLNKEYAKLECYGDDFGDFLDDLDTIVNRVADGKPTVNADDDYRATLGLPSDEEPFEDRASESEESTEIVPMKDPAFDQMDEDDSVMEEIEAEEGRKIDANKDERSQGENNDNGSEESQSESDSEYGSDDDSDDSSREPDHDVRHTYRPTSGEDIYGNKVDASASSSQSSKYVPPHLRNKMKGQDEDTNDKDREESLRTVQRSLNGVLNRLSEDTLVPVAQSIVQLYPSHPTSYVNESIWRNIERVCVAKAQLMTGLIPVYVAALAGVHIEKGDSAQLGEYLMEMSVVEFWQELKASRDKIMSEDASDAGPDAVSKKACNLLLILSYLYNFGIIHCSLLYDVVRNLISSFTEVDMELILLILSHCGRALRSDDPSALKEIVLSVQKRSLESKNSSGTSSRVEYMLSAMQDLKNNKRRKQDTVYAEKTAKLRKAIGHIKSKVAASSNSFRASESSLRISLEDILNAETKGRWWKVGASWVGNQYRFQGDETEDTRQIGERSDEPVVSKEDEKVLKLAAKYRMNSDTRRSIFCIIMGAADCDDAFEKLVRAGMLKNRTERDTVRVLMECCGNEKAYNKFYSHLAFRLCEYQQECKFSFQLAFWDLFKQFDELKARKAANLAKLLFHLVVIDHSLKLNVLKPIDMSSPDELSETAMIFLTIFLSSIMEYFEDQKECAMLFERGITRRKAALDDLEGDMDEMGHTDESEALRASLTVFFIQVLKASPKYKKGSIFRANLKAAIKACDVDNFF